VQNGTQIALIATLLRAVGSDSENQRHISVICVPFFPRWRIRNA
jgi:hypothetical protein